MIRTVIYAFAIVYGLAFAFRQVHDPDLGWQLFGGAWIVKHQAVPSADGGFDPVNSFNSGWLDYHWLGQIMLYKAYKLAGYESLRWFFALIMVCVFLTLTRIITIAHGKRSTNLTLALFLLLVIILINHIVSLRLQMLSILMVAQALLILMQPARKLEIWVLLAITIIACNVHVYWIFIPLLYFLSRIAPELIKKRACSRQTLAGFVFLSLAGFVSPYGGQNYLVLWDYLTMPRELKNSISELQSSLNVWPYAVLSVLTGIIFLARKVSIRIFKRSTFQVILALIGVILALRSVKFIALYALFSLPLIIRSSCAYMRKLLPRIFERDILTTKVAIIVMFALTLITAYKSAIRSQNTAILPETLPEQACLSIATLNLRPKSDRNHIRVLTHFNHGGWCRWFLHQAAPDTDYRVTTDGRTQFVPAAHYKQSFELFSVKYTDDNLNWENTLQSWSPDVALIAVDMALAEILKRSTNWRETYRDKHFAVFIPTGS